MNFSTESSCSLSSTQRMIFLGRMMRGHTPSSKFVGPGRAETRLRKSASPRHPLERREYGFFMSWRRAHEERTGSDSLPREFGCALTTLAGANSHDPVSCESGTRENTASLAAGLLENSKRFRFGKAQLNSFQCFETVRALDRSEKREDGAKTAVEI